MFSKVSITLDKFAISTSALCAMHCLCLPLMLSISPALGITFFGEEAFHVLLLWLVIPFSLISLSIGCRQHKSLFVALLGFIGLAILIFTAIMGHDLLGEVLERIATLLGAAVITSAHVKNYRLCRQASCSH